MIFECTYKYSTISAEIEGEERMKSSSILKMTTSTLTAPGVVDWILIAGRPGRGKTTAVKRVVELLQRTHGYDCQGFYTEEVIENGPKGSKKRIGFDIITVPNNERGILARNTALSDSSSFPKTGKFSIDVDSFEKLVLPAL
jgi:nucleoside-triphosphatase THEP1